MKIDKIKCYKIILKCTVIVQFTQVVLINLLHVSNCLDMDSSMAIRHAIEMWRHGLFLKDFNYVSSMEIDCASFFAAPIYMVTGNLNLSLAIIHGILYIIVAAIVLDIFKNCGKSLESGLIAILLIFTPFRTGQLDWNNMLFFVVGQYEFRVISLLLVIDLVNIGVQGVQTR